MSSPQAPSVASTAAVTRSHTPTKEDGGNSSDENEQEEKLPEKLQHLLAQSSIYARIIGEKLARETEERKKKAKKDAKLATKRANKEKRDVERALLKGRSTRQAAANATNGTDAKPADSKVKQENGTSRRGRKRAPSLLSSSEDSDPEDSDVKTRDFGASTSKAGKRAGSGDAKVEDVLDDEDKGVDNSLITEGVSKKHLNGNGKASAVKEEEDNSSESDNDEDDVEEEDSKSNQPKLVTGATMKSYQLTGMEWLISLYENGLNGILADEMGLGKTLQTISLLAYLRERGVWGPFLVCCPMSTLANWVNEFEKFTPGIPTILYHGTPEERKKMRAERMQLPVEKGTAKKTKGGRKSTSKDDLNAVPQTTKTFPVVVTSYEIIIRDRKFLSKYMWKYLIIDESHRIKNLNCVLIKELMSYKSANRLLLTGTPLQNNLEELWSLLNFLMPEIFNDLDSFKSWFDIDVTSESSASSQIVSKLHDILKPFLLRRIKRDVEKNLPPKKEYLISVGMVPEQHKLYDATIKRQIRNFLLGKNGALAQEMGVPAPKEEESASEENGEESAEPEADGAATKQRKKRKVGVPDAPTEAPKKRPRISYKDQTDSEWLDSLDDGSLHRQAKKSLNAQIRRMNNGRLYASSAANEIENGFVEQGEDDTSSDEDGVSTGNGDDSERERRMSKVELAKLKNQKFGNVLMQLRKVVNHPWLFEWPTDKKGEPILDERIITSSGKMMLLERLLKELFKRGHKVLLFSQFTKSLDIIEDWAVDFMDWNICRIDGMTKQDDRRALLKDFNEGTGPDSAKLFLLSTRAGGVGINLTGADTVILFDSDWNPQMDLQAMDRAHRLGQTKPVLVFRLICTNTIEGRMLERATNKRRLEHLVIGTGKYTASAEDLQGIFTRKSGRSANEGGMAANLFAEELRDQAIRLGQEDKSIEGDTLYAQHERRKKAIKIINSPEDVISQEQLEILLDRSPEAMSSRGKGWNVEAEDGAKKAFEVVETAVQGDETEDEEIAGMMDGKTDNGTEDSE